MSRQEENPYIFVWHSLNIDHNVHTIDNVAQSVKVN